MTEFLKSVIYGVISNFKYLVECLLTILPIRKVIMKAKQVYNHRRFNHFLLALLILFFMNMINKYILYISKQRQQRKENQRFKNQLQKSPASKLSENEKPEQVSPPNEEIMKSIFDGDEQHEIDQKFKSDDDIKYNQCDWLPPKKNYFRNQNIEKKMNNQELQEQQKKIRKQQKKEQTLKFLELLNIKATNSILNKSNEHNGVEGKKMMNDGKDRSSSSRSSSIGNKSNHSTELSNSEVIIRRDQSILIKDQA